jgi:hypothetical protein
VAVKLEIRGAEDFARLAARLREVGDKDLRRKLYKGLNAAAKSAKAAIKPNVRAKLPQRGGAAEFIASTLRVTQSNRGGGANPRVVIWSKSNHNIRAIDRGQLRHPVYGRRNAWAVTQVEPDTFTEPIESRAPEMREEMVKVIRVVAAKVERGR